MDIGKLKRVFKSPLRYEALRQLYMDANRKIVSLEHTLKESSTARLKDSIELEKVQKELLQKGVNEHFLEEKISTLEAKIRQFETSGGESVVTDIFLVLYDHFDTMEVEYIGQSLIRATEVYKQNKLHEFYHYREGKIIQHLSHRYGRVNNWQKKPQKSSL